MIDFAMLIVLVLMWFFAGYVLGRSYIKTEEKTDDPSVRNVDEIIRKNGI